MRRFYGPLLVPPFAVALALALPILALAGGEPVVPGRTGNLPEHPWTLGSQLPNFRAQDLQGKPVALRDLKGAPMLVNLWATWCGACMAELPAIKAIDAKYKSKGLRTVGISLDDRRGEVEMIVGDLEIPYTVLFDPGQLATEVWRADTIPDTFLYDRSGRLVWRYNGIVRPNDPGLEAALKAVTAKP